MSSKKSQKPSNAELEYKKLAESIEELKIQKKDLNKKIKNLDSYKNYIKSKKILEVSPQFIEMKNFQQIFNETPEFLERVRLNDELKQLIRQIYEFDDQSAL